MYILTSKLLISNVRSSSLCNSEVLVVELTGNVLQLRGGAGGMELTDTHALKQ